MTWTRLRVDYHDGPMDDLILDALRPAWREGTRGYFVRHWIRGPHLRVFVDGDARRTVRAIERYLAAHPSAGTTAPESLLPLHERLAELEGEQGPLMPWEPDNTVTAEPLGIDTELDRFLAGFYADTTEAAFEALDRVRGGTPLPGIAFDLVVSTVHHLSGGGLPAARTSLRSHAEAYLARTPGLRERWQAHYERNRAALTARIEALTATAEPAGWLDTLRRTRDRGRALIDEGRLRLGYDTGGTATQPPLAEVSAFHRRLETDETWLAVKDTPAFAAYRLVLNCTYLHLTRLGLSPDRRFLVCYLAANAADDVYRAVAS
ncbi:lantibiotic dehydratase C-terminal domain-containing protein [Nonomuraea sp. N2-4H]|jgi:hypothetical protein|uniref:lantibiotic dehydratase C-terminal domain-containing protein n=1 Tax=Nonomuraea sp. N2-4H TaxID=3128898 RepID=UPI0032478362